jgi:hypothetical protein
VSDIDTTVVDSLKVLDPRRPIREGDITLRLLARQQWESYSMASVATSQRTQRR